MQVQRNILDKINWPDFFKNKTVFELWRDLLTLTAVVGDPESSEEQAVHNKLPFSLKDSPVLQDRRQSQWNLDSKRIKA